MSSCPSPSDAERRGRAPPSPVRPARAEATESDGPPSTSRRTDRTRRRLLDSRLAPCLARSSSAALRSACARPTSPTSSRSSASSLCVRDEDDCRLTTTQRCDMPPAKPGKSPVAFVEFTTVRRADATSVAERRRLRTRARPAARWTARRSTASVSLSRYVSRSLCRVFVCCQSAVGDDSLISTSTHTAQWSHRAPSATWKMGGEAPPEVRPALLQRPAHSLRTAAATTDPEATTDLEATTLRRRLATTGATTADTTEATIGATTRRATATTAAVEPTTTSVDRRDRRRRSSRATTTDGAMIPTLLALRRRRRRCVATRTTAMARRRCVGAAARRLGARTTTVARRCRCRRRPARTEEAGRRRRGADPIRSDPVEVEAEPSCAGSDGSTILHYVPMTLLCIPNGLDGRSLALT